MMEIDKFENIDDLIGAIKNGTVKCSPEQWKPGGFYNESGQIIELYLFNETEIAKRIDLFLTVNYSYFEKDKVIGYSFWSLRTFFKNFKDELVVEQLPNGNELLHLDSLVKVASRELSKPENRLDYETAIKQTAGYKIEIEKEEFDKLIS
jgi:hypothetical protein